MRIYAGVGQLANEVDQMCDLPVILASQLIGLVSTSSLDMLDMYGVRLNRYLKHRRAHPPTGSSWRPDLNHPALTYPSCTISVAIRRALLRTC